METCPKIGSVYATTIMLVVSAEVTCTHTHCPGLSDRALCTGVRTLTGDQLDQPSSADKGKGMESLKPVSQTHAARLILAKLMLSWPSAE